MQMLMLTMMLLVVACMAIGKYEGTPLGPDSLDVDMLRPWFNDEYRDAIATLYRIHKTNLEHALTTRGVPRGTARSSLESYVKTLIEQLPRGRKAPNADEYMRRFDPKSPKTTKMPQGLLDALLRVPDPDLGPEEIPDETLQAWSKTNRMRIQREYIAFKDLLKRMIMQRRPYDDETAQRKKGKEMLRRRLKDILSKIPKGETEDVRDAASREDRPVSDDEVARVLGDNPMTIQTSQDSLSDQSRADKFFGSAAARANEFLGRAGRIIQHAQPHSPSGGWPVIEAPILPVL
ncbi:MAG: hypothetical protein M1816_003904 [Peltula sp. TS41687]|nr:MAG: hypothetical protein M1816_003904 [Peltula sp. TS41687]